jgi:Tol biopolymer transport system component
MAPEVLQGKTADARTDIFALGLVLYEMVDGKKAFSGQTYPQVMAAILEREPAPLTQVSASVDRLIRKCLAKDPEERWQSAHDLRDEIRWQLEFGNSETRTRTRNRAAMVAWSVAALAIAVAILVAAFPRETPITPRFAFTVTPNDVLAYSGASEVALSPDHKHLAFAAAEEHGRKILWLRTLDSPFSARPLPGTENAWYPFWSPESRRIGFSAEGKLKVYSLDGNSVQVLADAPVFTQCDWGPGDAIVCGDFAHGGLFRLPATGGRREPLTQLDKEAGELAHLFPQFLPDRDHILYYVNSSRPDERGVYVRSMQDKGRGKRILKAGRRAVFDNAGYLLEVQGENFVAHPFDLRELRVTGSPVTVRDIEGVGTTARLYASVSVSGDILAFGGADYRRVDLVMYDRKSGRRDPMNVSLAPQFRCTQVRLSPDEKWAALEILDLQTNTYDIWLLELGAGRINKFTTNPANERDPVFSPDGRRIAFTTDRNGVRDLYEKEIGANDESALLESPDDKYLEDSPTTGSLVFRIREGFGGLFQLSGGKPTQLLPPADHRRDEFNLSPDRKWIAFNTEESGNYEVKVASFPDLKNQRAVSSGGGAAPRWRKDGGEIFYLSMSGDLMAARVSPAPDDGTLQISAPDVVTRTRINVSGGRDQYAVSGDGQRFLLLETSVSEKVPPITLVTNWQSLLQP